MKHPSLPFQVSQVDDSIHDEETRFLDALHESLIDGNYTLLTQAEFDESEGEFSTEVKVALDTSHLSGDIFERFLEHASLSNTIMQKQDLRPTFQLTYWFTIAVSAIQLLRVSS